MHISDPKVQAAIDYLAPDFVDYVKRVESGLPTTMNHYGTYMTTISQFQSQGTAIMQIVAEALKRAGANSAGVDSAL